MKKAQLLSMELIVVLSVFLGIITLSVFMWNQNIQEVEKFDLQKSLQEKSFSSLDMLIHSKGNPPHWNTTNVQTLGLIKTSNILDEQKINNLFNMSYDKVKTLLAVQPHDFYIDLYCIGNKTSSNITNTTCDTTPIGGDDYHGNPNVLLKKTACPVTIPLDGITTINISVKGVGIVDISHPIDVVLVIDRSGSMAGTPMTDAKKAAKNFIDNINDSADKTSVVSFTYGTWWCDYFDSGCYANLDQTLTTNGTLSKNAIDSLTANGYTAIGEGIKTAIKELVENGRNVSRVQVLLSDGQNNRGVDPIQMAYNASNHSIRIYTIGLGSSVNTTLMKQIASITKGKYYFAPNSSELESIYEQIAKEFTDVAAKNLTIVDHLQPNITISGALPYECSSNQDSNGVTYVTCNVGEDLNVNETLSYVFNVKVSNLYANSTNNYSYITYLDYKNTSQTKYFEDPEISVYSFEGYCEDFPYRRFGLSPTNNSEVVVSKRMSMIGNQNIFVEMGVWEDKT